MIKGKNTKPEIIVRRYLHGKGLRYRLHEKKLPGKPDIVLRKYNSVVFVNGCFFHGHEGCLKFKYPEDNKVFWRNKIDGNRKRESKNIEELQKMNWRVFTIWECELTKDKSNDTLSSLYNKIIK